MACMKLFTQTETHWQLGFMELVLVSEPDSASVNEPLIGMLLVINTNLCRTNTKKQHKIGLGIKMIILRRRNPFLPFLSRTLWPIYIAGYGFSYQLSFGFQTRWLHCTAQNMFTLHGKKIWEIWIPIWTQIPNHNGTHFLGRISIPRLGTGSVSGN